MVHPAQAGRLEPSCRLDRRAGVLFPGDAEIPSAGDDPDGRDNED